MPQAGRITPQAIAIGRGFDRPNARMPILETEQGDVTTGRKFSGNCTRSHIIINTLLPLTPYRNPKFLFVNSSILSQFATWEIS
jgi:hypothetical protein